MENKKIKIQNKKLLMITFVLFILFPINKVFAICDGAIVPCGRYGTPPCTLCHGFELLNNVLELILTCLAPIVAVLMLVVGGIMFMLSRLEVVAVDIFTQAKGAITAVVVGLVIIFSAWVFLNTFLTVVGIAEWTGMDEWWEIKCRPPIYCSSCSDCPSGEYCDQITGTCLGMPACAECNSDYGYNPQEYGEDQWDNCPACQTCSGTGTGAGSCDSVTDNIQTPDCSGTCEACQSGICSNATAGTDPGSHCGTDSTYQEGGSPNYCQSREKDGNCNGSGSCNSAYGSWQNINEGLSCAGSYACQGDTYYSSDTCTAGVCGGGGDIGCCACSKCSSGSYCRESDHTCVNLPTCAECNTMAENGTDYEYNPQESNEDFWNDCAAGSSSINGCMGNFCNGIDYYCEVQTSGKGGCPTCYNCRDNDIACEYVTAYNQDGTCTSRCQGCSSGSCVNIPNGQQDTWGGNQCTWTHYRCNGSGSCTAPLGPVACMSDWFGGLNTCTQRCGWAGYDFCYSSCNATVNCVTSWSATCGYGCESIGAEECQCRNYLYD